MTETKRLAVIDEFTTLLRSGKDYTTDYMYYEAGRLVYIEPESARRIINDHYKKVITPEMIRYYKSLDGSHQEKIANMAKKYDICERESRLIIRYIKKRKH